MNRKTALVGAVLLCTLGMFAGPGFAGVENILGKWAAKAESPNGPLELEIELKLNGSELGGTMGGMQGTLPLTSVKFQDPDLTISVNFGGSNIRLTGALKDGKITGKWVMEGGDMQGTWSAERKVEAAPVTTGNSGGVSGSWTSVSQTPGGDLTMNLELKQEGEKVSGSLSSEVGNANLKSGTFKNNALQFDIELMGNTYRVEGGLKEDKFSGKWSQVGGTDSGGWTATRKSSSVATAAKAPSAAAAALDGSWSGAAVLPDGTNLPINMTLKQSADSVSGKIQGPEGEIPVQKGKFANNVFIFEIEIGGAPYRIELTLSNGKLSGKWNAVSGTDTGAFTAEKKP